MAQLQNLVLKDRAPSPANHTFVPRNIVDGVGEVVESTGVPVGESRFTISLRKTGDRYKAVGKLSVPVVVNQTINGITTPVVTRSAYAEFRFDFAATSSEEERNNVVGLLESSLGKAQVLVNDSVVKLQGVY